MKSRGPKNCVDCNKPIGEQLRGKPRKKCQECSPPKPGQPYRPKRSHLTRAPTVQAVPVEANIGSDYKKCCSCPTRHNHTEPWCSPKCRQVLAERVARAQKAEPVRKVTEGREPYVPKPRKSAINI